MSSWPERSRTVERPSAVVVDAHESCAPRTVAPDDVDELVDVLLDVVRGAVAQLDARIDNLDVDRIEVPRIGRVVARRTGAAADAAVGNLAGQRPVPDAVEPVDGDAVRDEHLERRARDVERGDHAAFELRRRGRG